MTATASWFDAHTGGAPEVLLSRAKQFFVDAGPGDLATRLAEAGGNALGAAIRDGARRKAALDLLAADALITLALLASAESDPEGLGRAAARLRAHASAAGDAPYHHPRRD